MSVTPLPVTPKPLYRIYVDETGDRGFSAGSSPYFILAALIVRDGDEAAVRASRNQLVADLIKPPGTVLHWAQNIKSHSDRKFTATCLGSYPVELSYVIVDKASASSNSGIRHHERLYNYAVRRLIERVSWNIRDKGGEAILTFAHVKNFKYASLHTYLAYLQMSPTTIHWKAIRGAVRIDSPNRIEMLQLADLAAGCLGAAIVPDFHGAFEYAYLNEIQHLVYRRPSGPIWTYGLHMVGPTAVLTSKPWWPAFPNK
jgi:hypothetical protein